MSASNTPDPYNGFTRDDERRKALNVHAICNAISSLGNSAATAIKGIAALALVLYLVANPDIPKSTWVWIRNIV